MLLDGANDVLRVVSSSTSALDVAVMFAHRASGVITVNRQLTAIVTATTTTVLSAPGASASRKVKDFTVRNKGAGTQTVIIELYNGTTAYELHSAVLGPGCSLQYHEAAGWWVTDSQGREVTAAMGVAGTPISDADTIVMLSSDVTNNNGTANTIADVTGVLFPVLAGKLYWFEFDALYTAAATSTGSRWSITGPASPTMLSYTSEYSLTATTATRNALLQAYDVPAASNGTSATTGNNWANIYGLIMPSANGNVQLRFASEVASSAIVAKAGTFVRYRQITP